jgi:hypothetical protein
MESTRRNALSKPTDIHLKYSISFDPEDFCISAIFLTQRYWPLLWLANCSCVGETLGMDLVMPDDPPKAMTSFSRLGICFSVT